MSEAISEDRIVANEVSLRNVNEAIEAGRRTRDGLAPFVCECGALGCNEVIELTIDDYERVRAHGTRFVVAPGHASRIDAVIAVADGYDVVEKRSSRPAADAERADPRQEAN
jgi:hypothetical protein